MATSHAITEFEFHIFPAFNSSRHPVEHPVWRVLGDGPELVVGRPEGEILRPDACGARVGLPEVPSVRLRDDQLPLLTLAAAAAQVPGVSYETAPWMLRVGRR